MMVECFMTHVLLCSWLLLCDAGDSSVHGVDIADSINTELPTR